MIICLFDLTGYPTLQPVTAAPTTTAIPTVMPTLPFADFVDFKPLPDGYGNNVTAWDQHRVPRLFDWNSDGKLDLLVGSNGYIWLYLNTGTKYSAKFSAAYYLNVSDGAAIVTGDNEATFTIIDMNGDGVKDLVLADSSNRLAIYYNTAANGATVQVFSNPIYANDSVLKVPLILPDRRFDIGDWNADGHPDVVTGTYDQNVYLILNLGNVGKTPVFNGTFTNLISISYNFYPRLYDINYDGKLDLVRGINWGDVSYWLDPFYQGLGSIHALSIEDAAGTNINLRPYTDGAIVDFGDLNGDDSADIVIGGHTNSNLILVAYASVSRAP